MIAYFESSVLVKLLIDEEESAEAEAFWDTASVRLTSLLTYVECRAALAAATRAGRLPGSSGRTSRNELDGHWNELADIGIDDALVRSAGTLAEAHDLRGYDAVHLASALRANELGAIVLVTYDGALARAARAVGLAVAPAA